MSWVDKVTTGTYRIVSVIANFLSPVELVIKQSIDQVTRRFISQFIIGISRVLQKLLKYFNGKIISTSFVFPLLGDFPVIFVLDLNDSESVKLNYYHCTQLSYSLVLQYQYLLHYLFLYCLFCLYI